MTDTQIITLFWKRDEEAIRQTNAVYGHRLYIISDKILRSQQDAEESATKTKLLFCLSGKNLPEFFSTQTAMEFRSKEKCRSSLFNSGNGKLYS